MPYISKDRRKVYDPAINLIIDDISDAEKRKLGERKGLDTRVVHAVNDAHLVAVIQRARALIGITGLKACVGGSEGAL